MELLKPYRERIDALDDQIIDLLIERTQIVRDVGHLKFRHHIPAVLQDRIDEVRERAARRAERYDLDPEMIRKLYTILIDYSCEVETVIKRDLAQSSQHEGS